MWKIVLHMVSLCILVLPARAQYDIPESKVWVFGEHTGLDFNSGHPVPFIATGARYSGSASVSNDQGHLLFYTSDKEIRNRNQQVMPDGAGISSTLIPFQGTAIVPFPGDEDRYYVFNIINRPYTGELCYSVVDMRLDNGLGDVAPGKKRIWIDSFMIGSVILARGTDCNVWLITHAQDTGMFKVYNITEKGLETNPVVSYCGSFHGPMKQEYLGAYPYYGLMAISPDYRQIAMAVIADSNLSMGLEIYDFDPATGRVSNPLLIHQGKGADTMGYAISFSPDNNKLFTFERGIVQYDLRTRNASAINASRKIVQGNIPRSDIEDFMQLGPDGKIYIPGGRSSNVYYKQLHVIPHPNLDGPAAGFEWGSVTLLAGSSCEASLPNTIVKADMHIDTVINHHVFTVCDQNNYTLHIPGDVWDIQWSNGAVDSMIVVNLDGVYSAAYRGLCKYYIDSFDVRFVNVAAEFGFMMDKDSICAGETIVFAPYVPEGTGILTWDFNGRDTLLSAAAGVHYRFDSTGVFFVEMSGSHPSCSNRLSFRDTVWVFPQPAVSLGADTGFCPGNTGLVLSNRLAVPDGSRYLWNTGDTTERLPVSGEGIYMLTVTAPPYCMASDTAEVRRSCYLVIPNAFSPNGDGINDGFPGLPVTHGIRYFEMKIYNRWGQLLFETKGATPRDWDGRYDNQLQSSGVYVYDIKVIFENGVEEYHQGNLTILY